MPALAASSTSAALRRRPSSFIDLLRKCGIAVSTTGTHYDICVCINDWQNDVMQLRIGSVVSSMSADDIQLSLEDNYPANTWKVTWHRM